VKNLSLINVAAGTSVLDMMALTRVARASGNSFISSVALA
jgi:hypothetical protein